MNAVPFPTVARLRPLALLAALGLAGCMIPAKVQHPALRDDVPLAGPIGISHRFLVPLGQTADLPVLIEHDLPGPAGQLDRVLQVVRKGHERKVRGCGGRGKERVQGSGFRVSGRGWAA